MEGVDVILYMLMVCDTYEELTDGNWAFCSLFPGKMLNKVIDN